MLAGAYRKQAVHKQNALDAQNNLYGIIMANGNEAMQSIKKALQGSLKAKLLNKFEVSAIAASMAAIAKQTQVSEWAGYNHKASFVSAQQQSNTGKILRGFFNPLMWAPVLILGLVLVGLDLMLARFSIATISADGIKIQIALFAFCTLVVALVWLRVVRNRIVRENASDELSAVIMLMQANGAILASVAEKSQLEMDEINSIVRKIAHKDSANQLIKPIRTLAGLIASYKAVEVLNRQKIQPATSAQIKSELKAILDTNKRVIASKKLVITKTIPAGLNIGINAELVSLLMQTSLENAFEIAEKDGKVDIKFSQGARNVSLNISGGGKALSRRMLHALEAPISNSRKLDAVGAGLYLSQIIVESVGGKFEIISDSKTGTYVKIKLPKSNTDLNNFKPNTELDNPELAPFRGKVKPA
jgi:signal transduction histidine kinase